MKLSMGFQSSEQRTPESIASYYEDRNRPGALASLYDAPTPLGRFYRVRLSHMLRLLAPVPGGSLLDVGCGTGQMLHFLAERRPDDFELTGVDQSESMIEQARSVAGEGPSLVVGQAEHLPFGDGTFDVAIAMGVYEYVRNVDDALRELSRVIRPGGFAIVTMLNFRSPRRLWHSLVYERINLLRGGVESPIVSRLDERRLCGMLAAAGLQPAEVVYYDFNIFPAPLDAWFPRAAMRVAERLESVRRRRLRKLGTGFIVAARKQS
jgi:ubiquinone/menaquinone biosynthesis C-methylase UbiE